MSTPFDFFSPHEIRKFTFSNGHDCRNWTDLKPTLSTTRPTLYERPQKSLRQSSAYALFFKEHQPLVRSELRSTSFGRISKAVAALWDAASPADKEVYKKRVQEIKQKRLVEDAFNRAQFLCRTKQTHEHEGRRTDSEFFKSPSHV